jgi:hypothetical protein
MEWRYIKAIFNVAPMYSRKFECAHRRRLPLLTVSAHAYRMLTSLIHHAWKEHQKPLRSNASRLQSFQVAQNASRSLAKVSFR